MSGHVAGSAGLKYGSNSGHVKGSVGTKTGLLGSCGATSGSLAGGVSGGVNGSSSGVVTGGLNGSFAGVVSGGINGTSSGSTTGGSGSAGVDGRGKPEMGSTNCQSCTSSVVSV